MTAAITLTVRQVQRVSPIDRNYAVFELQDTGEWNQVSKGYAHSTSAFAALGRLTQKETETKI